MRLRLTSVAILAVFFAGSLTSMSVLGARASNFIKGIDVSHWQGSIAWNQVASGGYKFAFAKATDGSSYTDPMYAQNKAAAMRNGIHFGAYHFAEPGGWGWSGIAHNAAQQARHYVDVARLKPGNLRPVLDLERNYDLYGGHVLSAKQLIHWVQVWITKVTRKVGVKPIIYSGASTPGSFWATHTGDTQRFAALGYKLWIPHYTSASTTTVTANNWGGHGWTFWQWSDGATPTAPHVAGISGNVDHDYLRLTDFKSVTIHASGSGGSGSGASNPPAATTPPTITGTPAVGNHLKATTGTWTNSPTSFAYAWSRCDQLAQSCHPISDATASRYTPMATDYGRTLEVSVTASKPGGSATSTSQPTTVVVDDTAPSVPRVEVGRGRYTRSMSFSVTWGSKDDASGVSGYDVWTRSSTPTTGLTPTSRVQSASSSTSLSYHGALGDTYCFSVRATDDEGNKSDRSPWSCTTVPSDDSSLVAAGGWGHKSDAAPYFRQTFSHSRERGDKLVLGRVTVRHVALVATKCRYCGSVRVLLGGRLLKKVNLQSNVKRPSAMIHIASLASSKTGRLTVKVRSQGRTTKIDGLAVSGL